MLGQFLILGTTQIVISGAVNGAIVVAAGAIGRFFRERPLWMAMQRTLSGLVLAAMALRIAVDDRPPATR